MKSLVPEASAARRRAARKGTPMPRLQEMGDSMVQELDAGRPDGRPGEGDTDAPTPVHPDILAAFDAAFYTARYPDVGDADPLGHFLATGWREGRAPTRRHDGQAWVNLARSLEEEDLPAALAGWTGNFDPAALHGSGCFDPAHYAAASGLDWPEDRLLVHYLTTGWRSGLDPSPAFSTEYYLDRYPDVRAAGLNPLVHFIRSGRRGGRSPAPGPRLRALGETLLRYVDGSWSLAEQVVEAFDADFYCTTYPDIAAARIDPLLHFMANGWREWRDPAPDFSVAFYLSRNPEVRWSGLNPLVHYLKVGRSLKLRTHLGGSLASLKEAAIRETLVPAHNFYDSTRNAFDHEFYTRQNPDVASAGLDAFDHYLVFGWREGRDPSPDFSTSYYLENNPALARLQINPFVHYVLYGRAEGRAARPPAPRPVAPRSVPVDPAVIARVAEADVARIAPFFDEAFYLARHPDVAAAGVDPRRHYLAYGWQQRYDPSPRFSTGFYLDRYRDIARAGVPPLLHYARSGQAERREAQNYTVARRRTYAPLVSAIVPNYNHAAFLVERLQSIAGQTYRNIEIIVLDDCSTDDSRAVIERTAPTLGVPVRLHFNEANSGGVFRQWRKGLSLARGELIWICESDDFCEPDFLERMIPHFADHSVTMAFGRIQFAKADGARMDGLDAYREGAEPGIWNAPLVRPAARWFAGAFGVNNVIANVGGSLFRNVPLPDAVWDEAGSFRICGDWYLYLHIAGAGQIAFEPAAVSYFRQHASNTSARNFDKAYYYEENVRVLTEIARHWGIPRETRERFLGKVRAQYDHFGVAGVSGSFDEVFDTGRALAARREVAHVQIVFLGFTPGGGELFPINLANTLAARGHKISMLAMDMQTINEDMFGRLSPLVAVYQAFDVIRAGRAAHFEATGVSVLHSHMVLGESFLTELDPDRPLERPLVVTLHGSYVSLEGMPEPQIAAILRNVSTWIYTADRNLEFFHARGLDTGRFRKLPNAMPADPRPAPFTRADLGIGADDVVFTLVARGIKRKGWRAAVSAFRRLRDVHGRDDAHLLLIGEGEAEKSARDHAAGLEGVHFLGYRSEINGIFRLSDVVLLPTRFEGESYPLVIVQALQEGRPVIATDVGEIRTMTSDGDTVAGILLPYVRDSRVFFEALESALLEMMDPVRLAAARAAAARRSSAFDMDVVASAYETIYGEAVADAPVR